MTRIIPPPQFSVGQKVTDRDGTEGTIVSVSTLGDAAIYTVSFPRGAECLYGIELTACPEPPVRNLNGIREFILDWLPSDASGDEFKARLICRLDAALSVQPAAAVVGEPVAWQPRYKQEVIDHLRTVSDNVSEFAMTVFQTKAQAEDYGHGGHEVRPLYAAPSEPDGWQPIDTAPRDGTVILARYQWGGESRFLVIRLSNMHRWWVTDHDGLIKHDEEKVSIRNYNFTHWRPLPEAPK